MIQVAAFSILALTVSLSLGRPSLWRMRIDHSAAAILGAGLCILLGVVSVPTALAALQFLFFPVVTIVSLMTITIIAERAGLFDCLARSIATAAGGDARRLFAYIFFVGSLTGTIFTNDAAVLIFTPLIFKLIEEVQQDSWRTRNKIPFYFAALYIANVAGALIISNPINIIVSRFFKISFLEYASWMIVPAFISIIVSYLGMRLFFRKDLPTTFTPLPPVVMTGRQRAEVATCAAVLFLTLVGMFCEELTGVPTWLAALSGAVVLLVLHSGLNQSSYREVVKGIGWDVIVFVVGIYIIANGVRSSGLTEGLGHLLSQAGGGNLSGLKHAVGFTAAGFSAVMNNHPTADMMAMTIQQMELPAFETKMLAFAALIGGDLGPKMLPIGSLAALMWFRMLRNRGVHVSYWLYIKIGVPVTLAAIFLSIATLSLEVFLFR